MAGVLGIAVGRLWDSRSEATRWRRDQKTECYQRLAEQFQATYEAIRVVAQAESDADGLQALIEHTKDGIFPAWDSALASVWLHGSTEVVLAASRLDQAIGELHDGAFQQRLVTQQEWNRHRVLVRRAFEHFLSAARKELDLPPVATAFFTDPGLLNRDS
ncbi:hypothetical protein [Nocardia shimofusensis]|uniref:hypothetical protein n=1 Tax=Nocardia shimofusensis TaxID=228596 RepID=UPI0012EDED3D|nr:hypothetical protein [Nocardia shimofusensis]